MIAHALQSSCTRMWWGCVFSIGCLAPTFFTAGIYIILGRLILFFGEESSLLSPQTYLWIFCTCASDIVDCPGSWWRPCLGGTLGSKRRYEAGNGYNGGGHNLPNGSNHDVHNLCRYFSRRVVRLKLRCMMTSQVKWLVAATSASVAFIYIRSIYRTVELLQGWSGYLITHEKYFIVLDSAMMVAAVGVFNVFHPAWLMPSGSSVSETWGRSTKPLHHSAMKCLQLHVTSRDCWCADYAWLLDPGGHSGTGRVLHGTALWLDVKAHVSACYSGLVYIL
ncbi:RTA1 domain-containing protein [Aspergillus alliaceus]|uniref:RTA1 domain-containing protein n=1 Tax=Petromyces alliaceus TaxID=209559 RepID=UPI0012A4DDC7|nr:uncharacterized protein BDW43DRAFT_295131 [Aspergillus alliaceus]KAB8227031.1 hypothetical protein BDW43DRAFT_295131 [Aspergillus alliaceus]